MGANPAGDIGFDARRRWGLWPAGEFIGQPFGRNDNGLRERYCDAWLFLRNGYGWICAVVFNADDIEFS